MYLSALLVEDNEDDALLIVRALERAGYHLRYQRVDNREDFLEALSQGFWQIILADHLMPGFSSNDVIDLVKQNGADIPVILVSGVASDEQGVQAMHQGAQDYVLKDRLLRLVPVIERELREAESRQARNKAEQALSYITYHDSLTNLLNRSILQDKIEQVLQQSRKEDSLAAVLFVDLDRFKIINDTFGHVAGDTLLQMVADRLRATARRKDLIARYGGDEFVVVMEHLDSRNEAAAVAEKIIGEMLKPFRINSYDMHIGCSVGIVFLRDVHVGAEGVIRNAELAMLRAKDMGRNQFQFYLTEMEEAVDGMTRNQLEQSLYQAQERGELELFYQPQVHVGTGALRGAEVLLRWRHPSLGLVGPDKFIDLLEETGLVLPVGEWVLETACRQWKAWLDEGLLTEQQVVSVNISSYQFKGADLVFSVGNVLQETELAPQMLDLEITEGTLMEDTFISQQILQTLKEMGVHLSIDDFGTGYSSLSYLKKFPIDHLKIDRSFVQDLLNNDDDAVIAKAIIGLSHNLKMKVIAEGVESNDVLAFLAQHYCDMYQGYCFSRPLPVESFAELLKATHAAATC